MAAVFPVSSPMSAYKLTVATGMAPPVIDITRTTKRPVPPAMAPGTCGRAADDRAQKARMIPTNREWLKGLLVNLGEYTGLLNSLLRTNLILHPVNSYLRVLGPVR